MERPRVDVWTTRLAACGCPKIARDFTGQPKTGLVGDIAFLRTGQGWSYLAKDLALVIDALEVARLYVHLQPTAVSHSDSGA